MIAHKRIASLDFLRGVALLGTVFFHTAIYNFANMHQLDFNHPPLLIVLISFMALWGGIFIVYSGIVNTFLLLEKSGNKFDKKSFLYRAIAGIVYVFFHYILNIFLGRWNIDFVNNKPDMTVVATIARHGHFTLPQSAKFFDGSSLSTIGFNIITVSGILFFLLRGKGSIHERRNYMLLGTAGFCISFFSFLRIPLFGLFSHALETKNYFWATVGSFTIANPYPLLPYLSYGFFGALLGMMMYSRRNDLMKKVMVPLGVFFIGYGLVGMLHFPKTISKPDFFWYFKTNFELGIFLVLLIFTILFLEPKLNFLKRVALVQWFSRVSLTIYMLETFLSEILRILVHAAVPSWDQTINGCLAFGAFNVMVWMVIVVCWRKVNFKYSLEYFWVLFFNKIGKQSTKLVHVP